MAIFLMNAHGKHANEGGKGGSGSRFTDNKICLSQITENKIGISHFTKKRDNSNANLHIVKKKKSYCTA